MGQPPQNIEPMSLDLKDQMNNFSDQDLLSRLKNFEDHYVERKSSGDKKSDWLEAAVAFANGVPIGYPAVLFLGVRNDGGIEQGVNLDSLQKTLSKILSEAYPPMYYTTRIVSEDEKQCLAVIIPGSDRRPHFAGHAYVREGSQTKKASEEQYAALIAERSGKVREILKWKGQQITLRNWEDRVSFAGVGLNKGTSSDFTLVDCNQYFVTIERGGSAREGISLENIEISYDLPNRRLRLEFHPL